MKHSMIDPQEPGFPQDGPDPYLFMQPTPRAPADGPLFRARPKEGMSGLTIGLIVAAVVIGLFAAGQWVWVRVHQASRAEREAARPPVPLPVPVKVPEPPAPEGVRRCANAVGEVTYTDQPCPKGTRESRVDTAEALKVGDDPGSVTLYRCKGAGQFWSIVHCQHRGGFVVSMHTVPANLSLADQIAFAQNREAQTRPGRSAPRVVAVGPPAPLNAVQQKAHDCQRLEQQVAALDTYARHALSPGEQDRVRGERQGYRDQQFRLRCGR
ncbi:hypothetical protein [Hydrogenophaga sp. MI9]|uniref:hypothetical protein n=1 Tax=Hydrogenophaga sp. MI9 TaxID=3453719 RepID=UPI003EE8B15B